jgi:hypothetical protein
MALGEPIGFSTLMTQNDAFTGWYRTQRNSCAGWTHIALMGDPTLRMHVVPPPSTVMAHSGDEATILSWAAARDNVDGYHVYRGTNLNGPFTRINPAPITATTFTDSDPASSHSVYMVRAVKLTTSASGTYFNLSEGAFAPALYTPQNIASSTNQPSVAAISKTASLQ